MKIDFSKLEITFKFRLEELENMIEVYTRQPKKDELEDGIRKDLRNIRVKCVIKWDVHEKDIL